MERSQRTAANFVQLIWRQKYIILAAILIIGGIFIIVPRNSNDGMNGNHASDFLDVKLSTEARSRFNHENTSMFDPGLLEETRDKWIISKHNISMPYNLDHPDLMDPSMGQAAAVNEIFRNMTNGFFIECGGYDGETRSNTLFFERYLNWSGLLIEADPLNFEKMTSKNRRANLSNTCLSTKKYPMIGSFLMADNIGRLHTPHKSTDAEFEHFENTADIAYHGRHVEVQCLPFATYVAALNVKQVDYFSLDIEGLEPEILETIPFDLIDIRTLSVEFSHNTKSLDYLSTMMKKLGYQIADVITHPDNLANDLIFVKRAFKESLV